MDNLGVDVAGDTFAAKAREFHADIVGVSALLSTPHMRNQKSVAEALEKAGLRSQVKIMVGGAPVTRRWAEEIGADGYAKNAMSTDASRPGTDATENTDCGLGADMRPRLELLDKPLIERILGEAFQLIEDPGVRVAPYVVDLLRGAGITVKDGVAHIPEALSRRLLDLAPRGFCLYDRSRKPAVLTDPMTSTSIPAGRA